MSDLGGVLLRLLPLLLPISELQRSTLFPLFSTTEAVAPSFPFHISLFLAFSALYTLTPTRYRLDWRGYWFIAAFPLILTQRIVDYFAVHWLSLGAERGALLACLSVETGYAFVRTGLVLDFISSLRRLSQAGALRIDRDNFRIVSGAVAVAAASRMITTTRFALISQSYLLSMLGAAMGLCAQLWPTAGEGFSIPILRGQKLISLLAILILCFLSSPFQPSSPKYIPSHRLLASRPGTTGRIVVGEFEAKGQWLRYLRADHSLLGGLWVGPSRDVIVEEMKAAEASLWDTVDEKAVVERSESVYSTFVLQEIARLVVGPPKSTKREEKALIIGLGAGIVARAYDAHKINTTVVEIDPVVYDFAKEYFGVGVPRGGVHLEDARKFVDRTKEKFDFVLHDVFTGGAVPSHLFTSEAWKSIRKILTPHGVLAVNFAGNVSAPATSIVATTLLDSFAPQACRAFSDGPSQADYRNLVFVCSNSDAHPIQFRRPVPSDLIGDRVSPAIRRKMLETFQDYEFRMGTVRRAEVLVDGEEWKLDKAQVPGRFEHHKIMGGIFPDDVWAQF